MSAVIQSSRMVALVEIEFRGVPYRAGGAQLTDNTRADEYRKQFSGPHR